MKRLLIGLLVVAGALLGGAVFMPHQATALSGSDFNAGRIIDDSVFYNPSAMGSDQIQTFLNAKVPSCDSSGTQNSSHWNSSANRYYTRAEWGAANGNPAPYTCLKDYHQDIPATAGDNYCKTISGASGQLASQIIYQVSQACSVNPAVLIVLLQKEQALVTDDWPWTTEYQIATGYGCPDSATTCDQQYNGFFNQVYRAARQFQMYAKLSSSFSYRTNGTFYVLYNPTTSCGGANVNIQTQATAALYNYTPYVPNAAALNNLQGTGDSCSAYGNRNFWVYFNNWFGSPTTSSDPSQQAAAQRRIKSLTDGSKIYTFYYDAYQQVLRLNTEDISSGTKTSVVLDGSSGPGGGRIDANIGSSIDAVIYQGSIQAYYYDQTHGNLRHAWTDSNGGWHFENLDGDPGSNSHYSSDVGINPSVMVYGDQLQMFYYDRGTGNLRHAWTDANGWHFENLDGDPGSAAHFNANVGITSTVMNYGGSIQLYYYDSDHGNLRHAWTDANGWHFENLDGDPGSNSHYNSTLGMSPTVVNYGGSIQLFYYDSDHGNLRHAWTDSTGWHFEDLDGNSAMCSRFSSDLGMTPSVTLYNGQMQLFYYDHDNGNLRHAWTDTDAAWHFENLDGDTGAVAAQDGDIGLDVNTLSVGRKLEHYYNNRTSGALKHGYADTTTGWHFENYAQSVVY